MGQEGCLPYTMTLRCFAIQITQETVEGRYSESALHFSALAGGVQHNFSLSGNLKNKQTKFASVIKGKKSRVIPVLEKVKPKLASRVLMNMTPIGKSPQKKKKEKKNLV